MIEFTLTWDPKRILKRERKEETDWITKITESRVKNTKLNRIMELIFNKVHSSLIYRTQIVLKKDPESMK